MYVGFSVPHVELWLEREGGEEGWRPPSIYLCCREKTCGVGCGRKLETAGRLWNRRWVTQSSPSPLKGRKLISLSAWARIEVRHSLSRYVGPCWINLCSRKGLHLVLWDRFSPLGAFFSPECAVGGQWGQAGRTGEEATKVNTDVGHALSQYHHPASWGSKRGRPQDRPGAPALFSAVT